METATKAALEIYCNYSAKFHSGARIQHPDHAALIFVFILKSQLLVFVKLNLKINNTW